MSYEESTCMFRFTSTFILSMTSVTAKVKPNFSLYDDIICYQKHKLVTNRCLILLEISKF